VNDKLLKALHGQNEGHPPVWLMRQAGRYLPEYRKIREHHTFMEMCRSPELVTEITLQPLRRFGFDAAILFSDILVVPDALKLGLSFEEGVGPVFAHPLKSAADVDRLPSIHIAESLKYVFDAIKMLKPELNVPLLGFAGAPFTVASYMIEGGSSKELRNTKQWMLRDPDSFHRLLGILTKHTIDYLIEQYRSGVNAVQVFESWAQMLAYPQFKEFSLPYLKKIVDALKKEHIPVIIFARGSSLLADDLAALHPTCLSIDWNGNLPSIRQSVGDKISLQGNLDPETLLNPGTIVQREARRILTQMKGDPSFIFNLGHGILPETPVDSVKALVDAIRENG
jgi:uroporphyrinogen decarboxylase